MQERAIDNSSLIAHLLTFFVFKDRMKRGYRYFIDLEIFLHLCDLLRIPLGTFQKNIIAYKSRGGVNHIKNPILPIKTSPIFYMIIAHHLGDGGIVDPKRGRKKYFCYRQYNKKLRLLYIRKLESI